MEKIILYTEPNLTLQVRQIIEREHRLNEHVDIGNVAGEGASVIINGETISVLPQWNPAKLPVLFPPQMPFNENILLGVVFFLLGNFEKSVFYFSSYPQYLPIVELGHAMLHGFAVSEEDRLLLANAGGDKHTGLHNVALALHYVSADTDFETVCKAYEKALQSSVLSERLAYTAKQYATWLSDAGLYTQASETLSPFVINDFMPQEASIAVKTLLCSNEIKKLSASYDETWMTALKNDLWECLQYYEAHNRSVDAAFVLTDASYIATVSNSFSEALGYIQRAIKLFEQEELTELAAQAQFQKAKLLYTWAQNGNPQFYSDAMKSCQEALNVFTKENAPNVFADIHHLLGVIYSEIPDEIKKKSIWAGVSVASFAEALNYYNKVEFPYEFGVICANQGNAYTKYPAALHSDNFDKALAWYREALDVRDAEKYPTERALTLLNYIEAAWHLNSEKEFDKELFNDMVNKANEVKKLNVSDELKAAADGHLEQLQQIRKEI
jgi:tetratricopeptide (TPR) repeat protein